MCGQCDRLNLVCEWADKSWTFVAQDPGVTASSSKSSDLPIRSSSSTPALSRSASSSVLSSASAQRSLVRTTLEIESHTYFWTTFTPKDDLVTSAFAGVFTAPWIGTVRDLARFDETVSMALNACAFSLRGRLLLDYGLLQEGTRFYAKALSETNKNLQVSTKAQSDAILACCKLLAM